MAEENQALKEFHEELFNEVSAGATAGADFPSRANAFVRRTTPHYSDTLRGKSYSVPGYHTSYRGKCK